MSEGQATTSARRRVPIFALLSASVVSQVGDVLTFVAVPWFVLATTGSAAKTGLTGAAVALARVLAGVFGGPVVDRLGFKRASVAADLASGATVATIPLLYHTVGLAFWQLPVLVFAGGFLDAPGLSARQSIVPDLARRAGMRIERANSAFEGIAHFSTLLGPPLAGVLIAVLTPSNVLLVDAASFAFSAAVIGMLVPPPATSGAAEETEGTGEAGGYFGDLAEGLIFIRRDRVLFSIIAIAVFINFLVDPLLSVVMPVYAKQTYGGAVDLGLILGAFGGGALVGTLLYGAVGHLWSRRSTAVVSLVVIGLPFWVLVAAPPLPVAALALAVTGLAVGPPNPLFATLTQERTPAELLGRVFGASLALSMAAAPLGMVAAGFAMEAFGVRYTLAGIAACYLIVSLGSLFNPAFREMEARESLGSK